MKKNWYQPTALLALLDDLSNTSATSAWAAETKELVVQLGPALARDSQEAAQITERLAALVAKSPRAGRPVVGRGAKERICARKNSTIGTRSASFARRATPSNGGWKFGAGVARLGAENLENQENIAGNPKQLSLCLANVETSFGRHARKADRWRDYLMLDALKQSTVQHSRQEAEAQRQIAQVILERIDQTPMSSRQRQFINQPQMIALRAELRHWAADPVSPADVLKSVERYEQSGLVERRPAIGPGIAKPGRFAERNAPRAWPSGSTNIIATRICGSR